MTKKLRRRPARTRRPTGRKPRAKAASAPIDLPEAPPAIEADLSSSMVVGVGASAGGFEAFSQLLTSLPASPGLAIVFVQHLSPSHQSALPQLLASATDLPIREITDGVVLRRNHVYVTPSNVQLRLQGDTLRLMRRPTDRSQYSPIDAFFRSLAENAECAAVGVLLSGNSSDGVAGLRDIRAAGGTVLVQDPQTARFDSMPRAAISAGLADLVLPPDGLGPALARLAASTPAESAPERRGGDGVGIEDQILRRIFAILRSATGVDFSHYKQPTIRRRLHRRMVLLKITELDAYLHHLEGSGHEVQCLYDDLLIQVTRFFRDPETFEALTARVFPKIAEGRSSDDPVRAWVPGCATGEEAYSLAITLIEFLSETTPTSPAIQIFATDVSDSAIERGRRGLYPPSITEDVSPQRLRRFFTKVEGGYQIAKAVRDLCVFARQDLARDPPFSRLDLIVCRNVLIYLDPVLHQRVMTVFHYALRPGGFLMLGRAESVGHHSDLFQMIEKKARIFARKSPGGRVAMELSAVGTAGNKAPAAGRGQRQREGRGVQGEATRLLLSRYAPPGVLIDDDLHILQARGHTGAYLELAPGDASLHLLKMAREGLLFGLRAAISEARRTGAAARKQGVRVKNDSSTLTVNLEVVPLGTPAERHFLVLFEQAAPESTARWPGPWRRGADEPRPDTGRIADHPAAARAGRQPRIPAVDHPGPRGHQRGAAVGQRGDPLQQRGAAVAPTRSSTPPRRSCSRPTRRLNTVNDELHARNEELTRVNGDLVNLLASVQIAIVMV